MANSPLTQAQLDALLRAAGQRLGTSPEQLKKNFQQGGLGALSAALSPQQAAKAEDFLKSKGNARALIEDPAVQQLLNRLLEQG